MKILVKKDSYIAAISGGVDSMVLLNLLATDAGAKQSRYIVAHFNHGIREDSAIDETMVRQIAKKHGLAFEAGQGKLGAGSSEAKARKARYEFLESVRQKHGFNKIMTAHHADDAVETAIINLLRGTGRKGMSAIAANPAVVRPLLGIDKLQIIQYAKEKNLRWRDDKTNEDEKYLRNLVRRRIVSKLDESQKASFLNESQRFVALNAKIDKNIAKLSQLVINKNKINRYEYIVLPPDVGKEILMIWLKKNCDGQLNRKNIDILDAKLRTAKPSATFPLSRNLVLTFSKSGKSASIL